MLFAYVSIELTRAHDYDSKCADQFAAFTYPDPCLPSVALNRDKHARRRDPPTPRFGWQRRALLRGSLRLSVATSLSKLIIQK